MKIRGFRLPAAAVFASFAVAGTGGCAALRPRRPPPARPPTLAEAYGLLQEGRLEAAAAAFAGILKDDPSDARARLELAYLDIRLRRWPDAVKLLDAAIEEDPGNLRLRMERGYARQALDDYAAAADDFAAAAREPGEFQEQARAAMKALDEQSAQAARKIRVDALLDAGYDDLRRGDKDAARRKFETALAEDPGRTEIAKQLGYMSAADGDLAGAARDFAGVSLLDPVDYQASLELGYLYDSLHNEAAAGKAFSAALASPDPKIRSAAAAALRNVRAAEQALYLDVYGSPYYTSRFSNKLAYFQAQLGYKPEPDWPFSFYLGGRYAQDTRSHSGVAPEIYADNVLAAGPGIRIQPRGWNANLTAEEDGALNPTRSASRPRATEADGQVVLADYDYWDGPVRTFADAGWSVGFYSRYRDNVIGLLQLRAGEKVWDDRTSRILLYAPVNVVKDRNDDFYNNLWEYGGGVELQPWINRNVKLRVEYLRGVYMGITGVDPNPYGRVYNDLRVLLVFSGHFTAPPSAPDDFQPTRRSPFRW